MHLYLKTSLFALSIILFSQPALANFKTINTFGSNPGELSAGLYAPESGSKSLVVLLHGCVQDGQKLASQSGFESLAVSYGFALLVPQQSQSNNIKGCFNWFSEQDNLREKGENLSIKQMILATKQQLNTTDTYIVGLSAGGAMASVMMVNYPELFDAGAIMSGVPYPCADNLTKAISCMRIGPSQSVSEFTEFVTGLNPNTSSWPKLSIWTGLKDKVVNPQNSQTLAKHWSQLLKADKQQSIVESGYQISQWKDDKEDVQVELIEIKNSSFRALFPPLARPVQSSRLMKR